MPTLFLSTARLTQFFGNAIIKILIDSFKERKIEIMTNTIFKNVFKLMLNGKVFFFAQLNRSDVKVNRFTIIQSNVLAHIFFSVLLRARIFMFLKEK